MKPTAARQGSLLVAAALLLCGTGVVHATSAPQSAPGSTGIDAVLGAARAQSGGDDFLPVDEAFRFDAVADGPDRVRLNWEIADGYYLYRSRLKAATPSDRAQLGTLELPTGQTKSDEYFGRQEVYHHELVARVPVARSAGSGLELPLQVTYQGCADAGLCYPPVTKTVRVSLPPGRAPSGSTGAARDVSSLKGGLTWLNWCQVHDVDPLHAPRADVETWWNDINTATSLGTSTRLLMVRAMSSWNLWTVREKHANVAYGAWVDQIGTVK